MMPRLLPRLLLRLLLWRFKGCVAPNDVRDPKRTPAIRWTTCLI
jgi:hypothetical protein